MTAIAYRDGVMAADNACFRGNVLSGHINKIHRLPNGDLYAAAGDAAMCWYILQCLLEERGLPASIEPDEFGSILVSASDRKVRLMDGRMIMYDAPAAEFYAIGSPCEFLTGALAAGASAEQAVHLAVRFCDYGGGDVQVERL